MKLFKLIKIKENLKPAQY